jgi:hypothetical protein
VSDGSPRPTCASTETRWPRTPTTVTPVTRRRRTFPSGGSFVAEGSPGNGSVDRYPQS